MKQTFEEADKNGDGLLNIEEIHQLMHKLNVNLPRRKVRQMFQVHRGRCIGLRRNARSPVNLGTPKGCLVGSEYSLGWAVLFFFTLSKKRASCT